MKIENIMECAIETLALLAIIGLYAVIILGMPLIGFKIITPTNSYDFIIPYLGWIALVSAQSFLLAGITASLYATIYGSDKTS